MTSKYEELMADLPLKEDIDELLRDGSLTWDEYNRLMEANARAQRGGSLTQDIEFSLVDD